jgi:hypothetical protein
MSTWRLLGALAIVPLLAFGMVAIKVARDTVRNEPFPVTPEGLYLSEGAETLEQFRWKTGGKVGFLNGPPDKTYLCHTPDECRALLPPCGEATWLSRDLDTRTVMTVTPYESFIRPRCSVFVDYPLFLVEVTEDGVEVPIVFPHTDIIYWWPEGSHEWVVLDDAPTPASRDQLMPTEEQCQRVVRGLRPCRAHEVVRRVPWSF